jgi:potassium-dependent mechanosensitive channel
MLKFRTLPWLATLLICLMACTSAWGQDEEAGAVLEEARRQLSSVHKEIARAEEDAKLLELRTNAVDLQSQLQEVIARLAPQRGDLEARIAELGPAPEQGTEPRDVAVERRRLEKARASLDGQIKLAGLLTVEAEQAVAEIAGRRREQFKARVAGRTSSLLGRKFWGELSVDLRRDASRIRSFAQDLAATLRAPGALAWVAALFVAAAAFAVRPRLERALLRVALRPLPPGRLHRSLRAFVQVVLRTLSAAVVAYALDAAIASAGDPPAPIARLIAGTLVAAVFGVFVAALGTAILATREPGLRLPALSDRVAKALRWFPAQLAGMVVLTSLVEQFGSAINLSLTTAIALDALMTLLLATIIARGIRRGAQAQIASFRESSGLESARAPAALPLWLTLVTGLSWAILIVSALCVLAGYVSLGSFIVKQSAWTLILLCTAYLIVTLVDDALMGLLSPRHAEVKDSAVAAASPSARTRAAVLLSALAKVTIALFALLLLLAPYGAGPMEFFERADRVQEGLSVGALELRPAAFGRALLVLVLGFGAIRLIRDWMQQQFLPTTPMDVGMRESITSLASYSGHVVVIALAFSALGVGLQQIAWIASALAVGIGFGLQAIVQNFVSGLILLAERPVKVGDWVSLGDVEGDVRRINVRATEIQKGDRSTVIVPNSEFITKAVRNVTYAHPLGLVQIKLPMPLDCDVERVRDELLQAFRSHGDILQTPEPNVMLDGIESSIVVFNAIGFVNSPRTAYGVRSALLYDALKRLRAAGIATVRPTTVLVRPPSETP